MVSPPTPNTAVLYRHFDSYGCHASCSDFGRLWGAWNCWHEGNPGRAKTALYLIENYIATFDVLFPLPNQVNTPALSLDGRFIFMPWYVNQGQVRALSFDANTYQLLSNSSVNPGNGVNDKFDFGTSLLFVDSVQPNEPACGHIFLVNSIPHGGPGGGNGYAEIMAYRLTDQGIQEPIWPSRLPLVTFSGFSPPGTSGYVNGNGQLTLFFNQPVKYTQTADVKNRDNANYIGFRIQG